MVFRGFPWFSNIILTSFSDGDFVGAMQAIVRQGFEGTESLGKNSDVPNDWGLKAVRLRVRRVFHGDHVHV